MALHAQKIFAYDDAEELVFDENTVEISDGAARLKGQEGDNSYIQDFSDDEGFDYNEDIVEFVGGVLRQKDQIPSGVFVAKYASNINATWVRGAASPTGTGNAGAAVAGGKLALTGGGDKHVTYDASAMSSNKGSIRFNWTANYNGSPIDQQSMFKFQDSGGNSVFQVLHLTNGNLFFLASDKDGNNILSNTITTFPAVLGEEHELEIQWDSDLQKVYVYGDGYKFWETDFVAEMDPWDTLQIGGSDGQTEQTFDNLVVYTDTQHSPETENDNYTPNTPLPDSIYGSTVVELPAMVHEGPGTFLAPLDFVCEDANSPGYTIEIGDSGDQLFWDGDEWAVSNGSQSSPKATISANIETLPISGATTVKLYVFFSAVNVQQSTDAASLEILESIGYSTLPQKLRHNDRVLAGKLTSFLQSVVLTENSEIRYTLEIEGQEKWHNGSSWVNSNGSFAKTNTRQEIEDAILSALEGLGGGEAYVKPIVYLKTSAIDETPEILSNTINYDELATGPRGFFDSILDFIDVDFLTDEEFESIEVEEPDYDLDTYLALKTVLLDRESVSDSIDRLTHFFLAKGVDISDPNAAKPAQSNIFIGTRL